MALDFTNAWPFNKMVEQTADGQAMVYIPKMYVKNEKLPDTATYAGKYAYLIAPDKIDDTWHVHPALPYSCLRFRRPDADLYLRRMVGA